ncbi:MAG: methionine--tRNA ligase, partial [Candidatus Peribacteraceae bacterium]|nr:methionine--tRNA ligase [Candidatus Peribacteraceae bacterium]
WFRLRGDNVRFQIGTDEHGTKIQKTAEDEGVSPKELVDRNVPLFEDLYEKLNLSHDEFIRTSDQKVHFPTVVELWKKLESAGMLEKRSYTGLYCSGCERFMAKRDLEDGMCPNHKSAPEEVTEENWFYLMSKDTENLKNLLTKDWDGEEYRILPKFRENETLSLVEQGLEDVSFSRPKESLAWGVPVPGDEEQTMYVWCDALTNYISGLGYFTDHEEREWWDDAEVTHVIGKDIARFHALIWPSMLKQGGVRTPDSLLIHGFLTSEGEKMSKSTGNVVSPDEVLEKFSGDPDPIRFYLSHEIPVGRDGDFSWKRYEEMYDAKLRNALGNLLNRVLTLIKSEGGGLSIPEGGDDVSKAREGWERYSASMDVFDLHAGIGQAMELTDALNGAIDASKPWEKEGKEKIELLSRFAESLRHVALLLLPFMPGTAQRISLQLGVSYADSMIGKDFVITEEMREFGGQKDWKEVGEPSILFAPLS